MDPDSWPQVSGRFAHPDHHLVAGAGRKRVGVHFCGDGNRAGESLAKVDGGRIAGVIHALHVEIIVARIGYALTLVGQDGKCARSDQGAAFYLGHG